MATPFDFDFTLDQVSTILNSNNAGGWYFALYDNLPKFDISTKLRVAAFLSQTAHESNNYTQLHENLNYRAESLVRTWPSRFTAATAPAYAHNQEKIANKVYADRLGNGSEASGDGWKYRGRGILQITGKSNYASCSRAVYGDERLLITPELLETDMDASVKGACWFWESRGLNALADAGNTAEITHRINGGYIGLDDRESRYASAMGVFNNVA